MGANLKRFKQMDNNRGFMEVQAFRSAVQDRLIYTPIPPQIFLNAEVIITNCALLGEVAEPDVAEHGLLNLVISKNHCIKINVENLKMKVDT